MSFEPSDDMVTQAYTIYRSIFERPDSFNKFNAVRNFLRELFKDSPKVFQSEADSDIDWSTEPKFGGKTGREDISKLSAYLINIQPIAKPKCKHVCGTFVKRNEAICADCGTRLRATFEEVKDV